MANTTSYSLMRGSLAALFVAAILVIGCGDGSRADAPLFSNVQEMGRIPTVEMLPLIDHERLNGEQLTNADFEGKVSVVNFWATWCGPCIIEIPEFVALQEEWKDRPFQFIGVSMDEEGFDIVRPFVEDFMMQYPQIMDPRGELSEEFGGVYALPVTFVVDGVGSVLAGHAGLFPLHDYKPDLDRLISRLENS